MDARSIHMVVILAIQICTREQALTAALSSFLIVLCVLLKWRHQSAANHILSISVALSSNTCRDSWLQNLTEGHFSRYSCAKCFVQVLMDKKLLRMKLPPTPPYWLHHTKIANISFPADPGIDPSPVCVTANLDEDECDKWKQCCVAATECCNGMLHDNTDASSCPMTWDGVACWSGGTPGQTIKQDCPTYYENPRVAWRSPKAFKECSIGDGWAKHEKHRREISDYSDCFDTSVNTFVLKIGLYIDFTGHALSIVALVIAITLTLGSRSVRSDFLGRDSQHLHINLFSSFIATSVFSIAFNCIYYNGLTTEEENQTIYFKNPIWCRALHTLSKYFRSATYMCMFSVGLYLYRRISRVMSVGMRENLVKYYLISWALPAVTITAYIITRHALGQGKRCWIDGGLNYVEFIYMLPNVLSLAGNFIFLISIEYNLCTKLRSHSSDRRVQVLRHALRATLTLIPMFGLQFLFIVYRPQYWPPYEIVSSTFSSTQGLLVAVLYCFTSKEVKETFLRNCGCCCFCLLPAGTPNLCCKSQRYVKAYLHRQSIQLAANPVPHSLKKFRRSHSEDSDNDLSSSTRRESQEPPQCETRTTSLASGLTNSTNGKYHYDLESAILGTAHGQLRRSSQISAKSALSDGRRKSSVPFMPAGKLSARDSITEESLNHDDNSVNNDNTYTFET